MKKEKIQELISRMTLEEKAGMCSGADFWHLKGIERLGIPQVMVTDGPHGIRKQAEEADHLGINESEKAVCFPAGCATASSFDRDLIRRQGEILGQECQAMNVSTILGPAMNIKRSPLCGRNFEYYSEDPFVSAEMAAAMIEGVQSKHVGTSVKHFAANNQEKRRMTNSSDMDERTLREIYLKGFEIAVKTAQPYAIMTSYNLINGTHAANHYDMLQNVARDEWGFEGFIMTDWYTSQDTTALGMVSESGKYSYSDGVQCIKAGNDLQMPGCRKNVEDIVDGVKNGRITKADLQRCAKHILGIALKTI